MLDPRNLKAGEFQYEKFTAGLRRNPVIQWDYRDKEGELHTGIAKTVEEAREKAAKYGYDN
jgi:hypothetical protein